MKKGKSRYIPMERSYVRPGAGSGQDPEEGVLYIHPTPVNPQPQTVKHSNTEELDAVVQTCGELLSALWWGGCFFIFKCFTDLPGNLEECSKKTEAHEKSFPKDDSYQGGRRNTVIIAHKNYNEYFLFSVETRALKEPVCPVCERRVTRLFIIAHDMQEADKKFTIHDYACGYCTSSFIADEYTVVIPNTAIVAHKNPNEYLLFSVDTRALDEPLCPVCKRRVTRLFIIAHDRQEADEKFTKHDYACGYCTSSLIADENMVIRPRNT